MDNFYGSMLDCFGRLYLDCFEDYCPETELKECRMCVDDVDFLLLPEYIFKNFESIEYILSSLDFYDLFVPGYCCRVEESDFDVPKSS